MAVSNPSREEMRAVCAAAGGPGSKAGWDVLWEQKLTLWDLGRPTPALCDEFVKAVVDGRLPLHARVLVPGCGSGYDVRMLAHAGVARVTGLDISELAIARAQAELGGAGNAEALLGDFFTDARLPLGGFDFIFDYTFFCAIPPALRAAWGQRTAALLRPGGRLLTLAFPLADDAAAADPAVPGPPHAVSLAEYTRALAPWGMRLLSGPAPHPLSLRPAEAVVWWTKDD